MNEASGSEPFKVGQRYVEKSMVCLSHTLANSKIVKYNELESNIVENPYGVFISNIGSRNTPGDILISYRDSYTDERTVTKIEVKSGTSSSIFQFTYDCLKYNSNQEYFQKTYADKFREIQENISYFILIDKLINNKEDISTLRKKILTIDGPVFKLGDPNEYLDELGFYKTVDFIKNFNLNKIDDFVKNFNLDHIPSDSDYPDELKKMVEYIIRRLKPLIKSSNGISFCKPFDISIDPIIAHYHDCDYIKVGKFLYSVNRTNPLRLKRNGKSIISLADKFSKASMTCYLKKPSQYNSKFRIICKIYNLREEDKYEISLDDPAYYPDKQNIPLGSI